MKVVAIVQARMGSTRLPGKVMKPLLGEPMLARQLERLARCQKIDDIVVATTENETEQPIVDLVDSLKSVQVFRGSEHDVLARYLGAARAFGADVIVRVTSDCPLIDPGVIDRCIETFLARAPQVGYVSNVVERTFPRGLDTEVFSFTALQTAAEEATSQADREHVTPFIRRQLERFPSYDVVDRENHSDLRWTVDTPEDFEMVTRVYDHLYPSNPVFGYRDVLKLVQAHPELTRINQHVEQKTVV